MDLSIVIPARDEEARLGSCLESIRASARQLAQPVEVVVVLNRCTDGTEAVATGAGARIVREDARNLAAIRNAGAGAAQGEILVTIDADSRMSRGMLPAVRQAIESGLWVGGGVRVRPERWSAGIRVSWWVLSLALALTRLSGGLYWCRRRDFHAIGGFDEGLSFGEDLDFAGRLRSWGRTRGLGYRTLRHEWITTSCRKFDQFGDWYLLRQLLLHGRALTRASQEPQSVFADRFFYDCARERPRLDDPRRGRRPR